MGVILRCKNLNYMLEIDILRNDSKRYLGVYEGLFLRVLVSKRHALLAKTIWTDIYDPLSRNSQDELRQNVVYCQFPVILGLILP